MAGRLVTGFAWLVAAAMSFHVALIGHHLIERVAAWLTGRIAAWRFAPFMETPP